MTTPQHADDFLSGTSGQVLGVRATAKAIAADTLCDGAALATFEPWRLWRAARRAPRRRVLALAVERVDQPNLLDAARRELSRSHHELEFHSAPVAGKGKFENLDELLLAHPADGHDWLLLIDDDVGLPRGFLDGFVFLAERFAFRLAQPAHCHRSHAAFEITRRQPGSVARQTAFVEIGPVSAFHATVFDQLLPFPPLRYGWGLDAHWSALAARNGWPIGVIDATPVHHSLRRIASSYDPTAAIAEAREFLAARPYTPAAEAQRTLRTYRSWR